VRTSILFVFVCVALASASDARLDAQSANLVPTFQALEQSLMDAVAPGDTAPWERVMAADCVMTDEEGRVLNKTEFLKALGPLPPGLSGHITVRDLTVQSYPTFAIVRFLMDETEDVFGQHLSTKYRNTDTFRLDGTDWKLVASETTVVTINPPAQTVDKSGWPGLVGTYQLMPAGWTFHVELRDGALYGGRDASKLRAFIPLTPTAFVLTDSLGEWLFVTGKDGKATKIVDLRKIEPLIWTRAAD
jgi:hypothetical protein